MTSPITRRSPSKTEPTQAFDALIIGAIFSGLYQLLCLRDRMGLSVRLLEAGEGVGAAPGMVKGVEQESERHPARRGLHRQTEQMGPFVMGSDGSRADVISKYRTRLLGSPALMAALPELRGKDLVRAVRLSRRCSANAPR
jgi:hypothetical protein